VLAGNGAVDPAPASVIAAISADVFGHPVDPNRLEPIAFDEVAQQIGDPAFRRQLIGAAIALGTTIHPPDPTIATRTARARAALDVDEPMLDAFERSLEGHRSGCSPTTPPQLDDPTEVKRE